MKQFHDHLISTMRFPVLKRWHLYLETGPWGTISRWHLTSIGIPDIKIRQLWDHFIFIMGIPTPRKPASLHWTWAIEMMLLLSTYSCSSSSWAACPSAGSSLTLGCSWADCSETLERRRFLERLCISEDLLSRNWLKRVSTWRENKTIRLHWRM